MAAKWGGPARGLYRIRTLVLFSVFQCIQQALMDDADACRRKMSAATALIGGLGGEKVRWTQQSKEFKAQIERWGWSEMFITWKLFTGPFQGPIYTCDFSATAVAIWYQRPFLSKIITVGQKCKYINRPYCVISLAKCLYTYKFLLQ